MRSQNTLKPFSRSFEPTRVFIALLIAVIIWLYPALIQPPLSDTSRQPLQEYGGITLVSAVDAKAPSCSNACQINVCTRWIALGQPGCLTKTNPWDIGCCTRYEIQCDPGCVDPTPTLPPTISAALNCSQSGNNGWCIGSLSLNLSASDPQGASVIISGTVNGTPFACPSGATSCSVPVSSEGAGTITYRVDSATGLFASNSTGYQLDLSTPSLSGSLSGVVGTNNWHRSNVTLNVIAADSASGIAFTETSANGGAWTIYSSPLTFTDGIYSVGIRTTDYAGRVTQTTQAIQVDTVTPALNTSISGTIGLNGWYVSTVSITPSASDSGSGLAALEVSADGIAYTTYASPITFTDGIHTYQFRATDNAGNVTQTTQTIQVDTTTPALNVSLSGASGLNGWYVSAVSITPTAGDSGSGLAAFEMTRDGGAWSTVSGPSSFTDGIHSYQFRATDTAGNVTTTVQQTVKVDSTTPAINLNVIGELGTNGWYISNVTVTPVVNDSTAGIASIEAALDGGAWSIVNSPVSFSDGLRSYQFRVTDSAGNSTTIPIQNLKVDTIPPAIAMDEELSLGEMMYYSLEDMGSGLYIFRAVIEDEDEKYKKIVWLGALSGNKSRDYILWDGKFADGKQAGWGEYFITLKISDAAGNETMKTAIVNVKLFSFLQEIPAFAPPPSTSLPVPATQTGSAPSAFGGENNNTNGGETVTTNEGGENNNTSEGATITTNEGGASLRWTDDAIVQSGFSIEGVSTSASSKTQSTNSNILWGAAATALVGATLADWQKKREEEARRLAELEARKAANAGRPNIKAMREAEKAHDAAVRARWAAQAQASSLSTTTAAMERKMARLDEVEDARWTASQAAIAQRAKEKKKAAYDQRMAEHDTTSVTAPKNGGSWLSNLWNAGTTALAGVLSPAKNPGGGGKLAIPALDEKDGGDPQWWEFWDPNWKLQNIWNNTLNKMLPTPHLPSQTLDLPDNFVPIPIRTSSPLLPPDGSIELIPTLIYPINTSTLTPTPSTTPSPSVNPTANNTPTTSTAPIVRTSTPTISPIIPTEIPMPRDTPLVDNTTQKKPPEDFDWLKKLNPPSWLSISGDAKFERNLFSEKFIGVTNLNRGIGEILAYEEQNLKVSISITGTRNPNGVVDINVKSGDLTLSVGNYDFFVNPFNATIGGTIKTIPDIRNPNIYREDTLAHDWDFNWGWTTNSIVTAHTEVTVDTKLSSEGFQAKQKNTVEGEVRTVKTTGIALTAVAVVVLIEVVVGGLTLEGILAGAASILGGAKGILEGVIR